MKNIIFFGVIVLLISSCGQSATPPTNTPEFTITVTENATHTPAPTIVSTQAQVEITPAVVSPTGLVPEELSKYVGLKYPPLPDELAEGFGSLVWDSDYSVTIISDNQNTMLWLSQLTHYDKSGKPFREVKDIIKLPKSESNVVFIPNGCLLNEELDNEILAIGKWDDEVFVSRFIPNEKIQAAWRANIAMGIFEVMSLEGIDCHADNAVFFK